MGYLEEQEKSFMQKFKDDAEKLMYTADENSRLDKIWNGEYSYEGGNYSNKCVKCNVLFLGEKHCRICKKCKHEN